MDLISVQSTVIIYDKAYHLGDVEYGIAPFFGKAAQPRAADPISPLKSFDFLLQRIVL